MRSLIITSAALAGLASAATAETDYSALIADNGLVGAETTLAAIADPTASDQFALGGVRFLASLEHALQTRYRVGMVDGLAEMSGIPVLRLPIFENPNPDAFEPQFVADMFDVMLTDLGGSLTALDTITDTDTVAVTIDTADLWFDINMNGTRDKGEALFEVTGGDLDRALAEGFTAPVITFDTADAAWLSAYAHLLSGVSEAVLAFNPTDAITKIREGGAAMDALRGEPLGYNSYVFTDDTTQFIDLAAIILTAIEGQPDAAHSRAAHAHLLDMIADNRVFWARVAAEQDNTAEWIPNKNQTSAMPLEFPADTGTRWRAVLADAEAVLNGDLLIPHWRLGETGGLNLQKLMQDPPRIDIAGVIQGWSLVPYAERGPIINDTSLRAFDQLLGGDAAFYAIILN